MFSSSHSSRSSHQSTLQGRVGVDVLLEAGEGVEESHQEEQDLRHQGSDGGDQEAVRVMAYDRGQPESEDRSL